MRRLAPLELFAAIAWRISVACLYSIQVGPNRRQRRHNRHEQLMSFLSGFVPTNCLVCLRTCSRTVPLCPACESQLPWLDSTCTRCGLPFTPHTLRGGQCGKCLGIRFPVDGCRALFSYNSPIRELISGFKHRQRLDIGNCLARLMAWKFDDLQADLLVPVPVSYRRFCGRGFNQSWELTRQLSRELGIRCSNRMLRKSRHTPAQSMQPSVKARQQNLHGAFSIDNKEVGSVNSITIIDDVVTTMTTVDNLARLLKRNGIQRVQVLCIARTCS